MTDAIEQIIARAEKKKPFTVNISGRLVERDRSDGSTTYEYSITSGSVTYATESCQCDESELSAEMADVRARISSELRRSGIRYDIEAGDIYINPLQKPQEITESRLIRWSFQDDWVADVSGKLLSTIVRSGEGADGRYCGEIMYRDALKIVQSCGLNEEVFRKAIESKYNVRVVPDPQKPSEPKPAAKKAEAPSGMLFDPAEFNVPSNSVSEVEHLNPDGSRKRYRPRK